MKNFFKSRFFIIGLVVAILLVIVPSVLSILGFSDHVRGAVGVITSPFAKLFNWISDGFEGFTDYFTEYDRLAKENEELKARISGMEKEIYDAQLLEAENEWLYKYLGLRRLHNDYTMAKASVISRQAGNYLTSFTLDRGSSSGVALKMPVITDEGIVGYVSEVGSTWCKVTTIIETAASVGAYCRRSGAVGVVEGEFSLRSDGLCRLVYIATDADIEEGDEILSSGLGEVYPRGLMVGTVKQIELDPTTRTKSAVILPAVTFSDIRDVMIITSYTAYEEE